MSATDYDLIIVGGGMVGASLAISLAKQPLRIALIEAAPLRSDATPPSYDDRAIALSFGSQRIFAGMHLWTDIAAQATAIEHIHVSVQGRFGFTRLDAKQENVEALGYVVTARQLGAVLMDRLRQGENLTIMSPATLTELQLGDHHATAVINHDGDKTATLTSRLVIAADGGNSPVRQQLDIRSRERDYGQTAIIANITPAKPHRHVAYERFTRHGPLALLPCPTTAAHWCGRVHRTMPTA